mmetsp:Transcript_4470/g.13611  ORF Transcript_4470/g.13611 Transcript_4470/m.13611 type:complete len:250 (+) Transcript_4470:97-846(+)
MARSRRRSSGTASMRPSARWSMTILTKDGPIGPITGRRLSPTTPSHTLLRCGSRPSTTSGPTRASARANESNAPRAKAPMAASSTTHSTLTMTTTTTAWMATAQPTASVLWTRTRKSLMTTISRSPTEPQSAAGQGGANRPPRKRLWRVAYRRRWTRPCAAARRGWRRTRTPRPFTRNLCAAPRASSLQMGRRRCWQPRRPRCRRSHLTAWHRTRLSERLPWVGTPPPLLKRGKALQEWWRTSVAPSAS